MQFKAEVIGISKDGSGIVEGPSNKKYFVFGVWPGDKGLFKTNQQKHPNKMFGYADLIELECSSKDRVDNPCPYWGTEAGNCQSCSWIFVNYKSQCEQKMKRLMFSFSKFADTVLNKINLIASPQQLGYRNRLSLKTDGKRIGMLSKGTHILTPIESCLVANKHCNTLLKKTWATLPNPSYHPPKKYKFSLIEWDDRSDTIYLNQKIPFRQANTAINEEMKKWIIKNLKIIMPNGIVELFCGSGNFTQIISDQFQRPILAYEGSKESISQLNKLDLFECKASVINLFKDLPNIPQGYDTLLLDPPRLGFKNLEIFIKSNPQIQDILYISCDSDTLCKDIRSLIKSNWAIKDVSLMDQFPQTPHFETLVHLQKTPSK